MNDVVHDRVFDDYHVFGHVLQQRHKATFGIEPPFKAKFKKRFNRLDYCTLSSTDLPRISAQFLVIRLQAFDNTRNSELVVSFRAVERPESGKFRQIRWLSISNLSDLKLSNPITRLTIDRWKNFDWGLSRLRCSFGMALQYLLVHALISCILVPSNENGNRTWS